MNPTYTKISSYSYLYVNTYTCSNEFFGIHLTVRMFLSVLLPPVTVIMFINAYHNKVLTPCIPHPPIIIKKMIHLYDISLYDTNQFLINSCSSQLDSHLLNLIDFFLVDQSQCFLLQMCHLLYCHDLLDQNIYVFIFFLIYLIHTH